MYLHDMHVSAGLSLIVHGPQVEIHLLSQGAGILIYMTWHPPCGAHQSKLLKLASIPHDVTYQAFYLYSHWWVIYGFVEPGNTPAPICMFFLLDSHMVKSPGTQHKSLLTITMP